MANLAAVLDFRCSVRIETRQKLLDLFTNTSMSETCRYCDSCFDIPQDENSSHKFRRAIARPVEAYVVGADAGCWHCAALLQLFEEKGNKKDYIYYSNQQGLGIFSQHVPDDSFHGKYLPDIDMNVYRVTLEGNPSAESKLAPIDIPVSSKSDECFMWIKERLQECASAHDCWNSIDLKIPKRLLEISNDRLILRTSILKEEYATLSHCWGTPSSASNKLLKSTYSNFTHDGIALGDLSLTFQDAADVCKRLGIQYIWIDSLCITQDDPQDWLEESTYMADIYPNAFIGLFAGHEKDGNGGLYSNSYNPEPFLTVEKIAVEDDRGQKRAMCIQQQRLIGHDLNFNFDLFPDFPSGWVFQELHLSPRAVLFNSKELTWVCNQDAQCECGETTKNIFATKYLFTHVPKTADYPVHRQNNYFGSDYLVTVEDAQVELGSIDRAGEVAKGHIVLRAVHIEEVAMVYPDDPSSRTNEYTLRDEYIRNSSTEELVSLRDRDCRFSFLPDYGFTDKSLGGLYIPPSEMLYCMPVIGMDGYWPFSETSLVLRRHSRSVEFGDTPDVTYVYERVGICDGQIMYLVKITPYLGGPDEAVKVIGASPEDWNSFI
ncbi:tol [Fusarium agapanthi]|uniref:Tol n=1 Tax=Fusarium agapanthi TaxID=1803897 RepID=A0A9P5AZ68_9HYPO|nr:tol [Fusarium agapanthi]